jgi:uncharacterized protein YkuJ
MINRLARLRQEADRQAQEEFEREGAGVIVDVRVVTSPAKRMIRVERVRDGFQIDKFAMDSRLVKRGTKPARMS